MQGFTVGVYQIHLVGLDTFRGLKPNIALAEHEIVGDTGGGKQVYKGVSAHTLIHNSHHNMC